MSEQKQYAQRNPRAFEPHYSKHMLAMTAEKLEWKSDIAAELAFRDKQIEQLRAELAKHEEAEKQEPDLVADWDDPQSSHSDFGKFPHGTKLYTRPAPIPEGYMLVPNERETGGWIWCWLMDYVREMGISPDRQARLFRLVSDYRAMLTAAEEGK